MVNTEVEFVHPSNGCGANGVGELVVFANLGKINVARLLGLSAVWKLGQLPKCEKCGVGYQVVTNCQGIVARES